MMKSRKQDQPADKVEKKGVGGDAVKVDEDVVTQDEAEDVAMLGEEAEEGKVEDEVEDEAEDVVVIHRKITEEQVVKTIIKKTILGLVKSEQRDVVLILLGNLG